MGMFYQWGRKDPFTFATSSQLWGEYHQRGKYSLKIYTIDGVLIYQEETGRDNTDKKPVGGVIQSWTDATSMMEVIKNPIKSYYGNSAIINQVGYTKSLWDYYWTSYSRGIDGIYLYPTNYPNRHNIYLTEYKTQRSKSIYDPCPYGYRIQSNGTYNDFRSNPGWISYSYLGGVTWNLDALGKSWFAGLGCRLWHNGWIDNGYWWMSTSFSNVHSYRLVFRYSKVLEQNSVDTRFYGFSVRCIEELDSSVRPDRRTGC